MKTIEQTYQIDATPEAVWQALIDPAQIEGWGGGPAVMDGLVGTKFTLWGGEIFGENTQVVPGKKLVQDWYDIKELEEPTIVTMTLEASENGTKLTLLHTNIPDDRAADIEEGWQDYYLGPLKEYLEKE